MEKKDSNQEEIPQEFIDDSFNYDDYVIEDAKDFMNDKNSQKQLQNAKAKMKRSVGKKIAGLFKGFFNKTSRKMKSTSKKKNYKNRRERTMSLQQPVFCERITLAENPEEFMRQNSHYITKKDAPKKSKMHYDPILGKLIPNNPRKNMAKSFSFEPLQSSKRLSQSKNSQEDYRKENLNESIFDIDAELNVLDQIQETVSEDELQPERKDSKDSIESIIQRSLETSKASEISGRNTEEKAHNIVNQIKDILALQFERHIRSEKDTHSGIKCNECQMDPIIGIRYKCAICIEHNLCEFCEIDNNHEHIFIKVRDRKIRIPMFCEIRHMAKKIPRSSFDCLEKKNFPDYPKLYIDVSSALENTGSPVKSTEDINKAVLVSLPDKDFLKTIQIQEVKNISSASDLLISVCWYLQNRTSSAYPPESDKLILKCLPNDYLIHSV
ncbi:unnamed protein product [Moneuplotes crassus]|uniref:ZZ-type domain-containing protein n=1 Tax=Euplotes crassus TaxID=5936 RepID=A0AAD1X8X0_EUPCR|nr:unnamed protein product [Moneuplotes crassus]